MTFADEVKAYKSTENKEAMAAEAPKAEAAAEETPAAPEPFAFEELPKGTDPVVPEVKAEAPKAAEEKKTSIKIGKQVFSTIEEAVEYAKELERAAAEDKAYIEGLKDAQTKVEEAPKEPEEPLKKKIANKLFEDPEEAIETLRETIKQEIRDEYNRSLIEAQKAREAAEAKKSAWDSFYQQHTDLSAPETREILENYLLPKLTREGTITPTDGFEKFADLARKQLRIVKEQAQPTKELPSGPVPTLGTTTNDTSKKASENTDSPVDFITALKRIRAGSKL